jgi:hypothetical protein
LSEFASSTLESELFDVIMLDEAGQLDFGNGALALHCLAKMAQRSLQEIH